MRNFSSCIFQFNCTVSFVVTQSIFSSNICAPCITFIEWMLCKKTKMINANGLTLKTFTYQMIYKRLKTASNKTYRAITILRRIISVLFWYIRCAYNISLGCCYLWTISIEQRISQITISNPMQIPFLVHRAVVQKAQVILNKEMWI